MKKITLAILLLGLVISCSKEEQKPTVVEPPIKFTADATPNNWEYVNRTDQNTINASFTTLERAAKSYDTYYIQTSITSDFTAIKANGYANSSATTTKPEVKNVTITITKQQFPYQGLVYFRVLRDFDKASSEVRVIKVNWN
jgi:hypothetical protein